MKSRMNQPWIRRLLFTGLSIAGGLLFGNGAAFAQPGGGNCQRGGSQRPNAGPQYEMGNQSGVNSFSTRGVAEFNPYPMRPVAPVPSRQELQAKYQAKMASIRERKAATKGANASRRKPNSTRPSSSSSPTANRSSGPPGRPLSHSPIS